MKGFSQSVHDESNIQSILLKMLQTFNGYLARLQSYDDLKFAIFCTKNSLQ